VTGDALADLLVSRGLAARERDPKAALLSRVLSRFHDAAGAAPAGVWWVPGRIEVFGKHTDYCGGRSLTGAVPRGFMVAASPRTDGLVRMIDARRAEELTVDASAAASRTSAATGWRNYATVVVARLARNFPAVTPGADIVFASDLPTASGMSSSSALMVGLESALIALCRIHEQPDWRETIAGPADAAGYFACIENGLSYGSLRGDSGVGTHGGSEDHLAIVCGRPRELSAWTFVPIRHVADARLPDDWTFAIASSGVAADKTGSAKEAYNRLSREAAQLLQLWNAGEPHQPSLRAALTASPDAAGRLRNLLKHAALDPSARDALDSRLAHFVREDERPLAALDAFARADAAALTVLSDASQSDAETLLRNQVPETVALARSARELGAFAASSFGAGFGGSVWALVDAGDAEAFAARWLAHYRGHFPHRTNAIAFVADPGPPLTRLA
jgi:galactokinase